MTELCSVGHTTLSMCRSVGSVAFSGRSLGENSFERSLESPTHPARATPDALPTRRPGCIVGMEPLAQRSLTFKDFVSWLERKCEHTRRVCNERDTSNNQAPIHDRA
jgi:hypothetical protein